MSPLNRFALLILVVAISASWKVTYADENAGLSERKVVGNRAAATSLIRRRFETLEEILPLVSFKCKNKIPGYYADPRFQCEVFHFCHPDGSRVTIPCPERNTTRHRICVLRDHLYKNCGQNEIYLALPEDVVKAKDTTASILNEATDFKFQNVLPQPTSPTEEKYLKHSTTPLSLEDIATVLRKVQLARSNDREKNTFKFPSKDDIDDDDDNDGIDNPFFIEKPQILPSNFRRGLNQFQLTSPEKANDNENVQVLKTVYLKNQGTDSNSSREDEEDDEDNINPFFIPQLKSSDLTGEDKIYLLEVYNDSLKNVQGIGNTAYEQRARMKLNLMDRKVPQKQRLLPGIHPRRRRKRTLIREIATGSTPYAIFYAKLPEVSTKNVRSRKTQEPTSRSADVSPPPQQQTVELTFDPSAIPKNLQSIPIAIRVSGKKQKKSRKKKPKPQVIYDSPTGDPLDELNNEEQRNYYYYYPQQGNPYLRYAPQTIGTYVPIQHDNQRPALTQPQQRSPQQGQNIIPEGRAPPRQRNIASTSSNSQNNQPLDPQTIRNEQQSRGQRIPDGNPTHFQPPPPPSSPQQSSQLPPRIPSIQAQPFLYGQPDFMQNLPPSFGNLPPYSNIQSQTRPQPQQQQQQQQFLQQPSPSPSPRPPSSSSQARQHQNPTAHLTAQGPPSIPNELRQNTPNVNSNRNENIPPPRNFPPVSETPTDQSSFNFFPSGFQSPFFQGFPPLPDFGNPFLPQPGLPGPNQFGDQFSVSTPSSDQQFPPPNTFANGPNPQPPAQQQYSSRPPQEIPEPQAPFVRPNPDQSGQRGSQPFVENNGQVTVLSNERARPSRRPKRPRPQAQTNSVSNDSNRSRSQDRRSRQRTTRPPPYNEEVNVIIPPPVRQTRPRPEQQITPPVQRPPQDIRPSLFNEEPEVIVSSNRPYRPNEPSYRPNEPPSYTNEPPSHSGYTDVALADDRRIRRPEPTDGYTIRSEQPLRERRPQRPPRPSSNNENLRSQRPPRPISHDEDPRSQRHLRPTANDESSRPQRPPRPISNDEGPRTYIPQNDLRQSQPLIVEGNPQSHRSQSSRRPPRPVNDEDRRSQRPRNRERSQRLPTEDVDQHTFIRNHNDQRPVRPTVDDDRRSYRTQNSPRPSRLTTENPHFQRSQSNQRPPRPVDDEVRSHRSRNNQRPKPIENDDDRRSQRPQSSPRQQQSENRRSRRPSQREPDVLVTTLPPRVRQTTPTYSPRDPQPQRRPSAVVEEYRNIYYPATTHVPPPAPTSYEYTAPPTFASRPEYETSPENYIQPSRQEEKTRYYVIPQDIHLNPSSIRAERQRLPSTVHPTTSYVDYLGDRSQSVSENQVNVVSGADDYRPRTYRPPTLESSHDYDSSRERSRSRYTTLSPVTETGFQPLSQEDPGYGTRPSSREQRYNSNSVENNDRRNRHKDHNRERVEEIRTTTTPLPRTTRKPKPLPPRPTFPSFPTFPPPPKRRPPTTTTERVDEATTVTPSSRLRKEFTDPPSSQQIQPKKRINSRPRTTTSVPVIIGTSTSVHRQVEENYGQEIDITTERPPQRKRSRKRTRTRHRKPRPTTTANPIEEEEPSASVEERREQPVSQPTRKSYKRRGHSKETITTTTPTPTTLSSKQKESDSSEEYGSRINLFGRQRNRKTTAKYTPRISSTTPKTLTSDASEQRKTLRNSASSTSTRSRKPYRKRTRTRTTPSPDIEDATDLNIARSDENVETLQYQDLPSNQAYSNPWKEETTSNPVTEPYNEFISFAENDNFPEATEESQSPNRRNSDYETATSKPENRVRLLNFGKPKLKTT